MTRFPFRLGGVVVATIIPGEDFPALSAGVPLPHSVTEFAIWNMEALNYWTCSL